MKVNHATPSPLFHRFAVTKAPAGAVDRFQPAESDDIGIYRPVPGLATAKATLPSAAQVAEQAWEQMAVANQREGRKRAPQIEAKNQILGYPRVNRPYPDAALEKAGVAQDLPLEVHSRFKWLMSEPLVLGENKDVVLLHTQYEGGPTWLDDGEYECRDFFIAARRDPDTGKFVEQGSLMTRRPEFQDVFRSVGSVQAVPERPEQFMVHLEEGTYNGIYGEYTRLYEVTPDGIEEKGHWRGHLKPSEVVGRASERIPCRD